MERALSREALKAEVRHFSQRQTSGTATPEMLAHQVVGRLAGSWNMSGPQRQWATAYVADKFQRRGIHHYVHPFGSRMPRHAQATQFGLDGPRYRTSDGKVFEVPEKLGEEEQAQLRLHGFEVDENNQVAPEVKSEVKVARQLLELPDGSLSTRHCIVKRFDVSDQAGFTNANNVARLLPLLASVCSFAGEHSWANFTEEFLLFSPLAKRGDLLTVTNKLEQMDLPEEVHEKVIRTLVRKMILYLDAIGKLPWAVYPLDIKPENLLLLDDGAIGCNDLKYAKLGNVHCTDPEATEGFQDPNIFDKRKTVYARDLSLYAAGATIVQLVTGEEPEGTEDSSWEGYRNMSPSEQPELEEWGKLMMQKDASRRPGYAALLQSSCLSATAVYTEAELEQVLDQPIVMPRG